MPHHDEMAARLNEIRRLDTEVERLKRREARLATGLREIRVFCADQVLGPGLTRGAVLKAIRTKAQRALCRAAIVSKEAN